MKKKDVIAQIAKEADLSESQVEKALDAFTSICSVALESGDEVTWGSIEIVTKSTGSKRKTYNITSEEEADNQANEPIISYIFAMKDPITKAELINRLEENPESYHLIDELLDTTGLPIKLLAEKVFEMTPKTLTSYRQKNRYLPKRSVESVIKLKELYLKGKEIFQTKERFNQWLSQPAYGLGFKPPVAFISSSAGIDLIYEELVKIEFGATA